MSVLSRWADDVVDTDVLVIGTGGAGVEAAIGAHDVGVKVIVVDRGINTRSGATITGGHTCCAALGSEDSPEKHFEDTVRGGKYMANQRLVEIYTREAPERIRELDKWGANFVKRDKDFHLIAPPGGHSAVRSVHYGFMTGRAIMNGLRKEFNRRRIERMDNILVTSLLTNNNRVVGATGLHLYSGGFIVFRARATVLTTGGAGQLYEHTTNPLENSGDGYSMAFQVGAELVDMEFMQFLFSQQDPRIRHINPTLVHVPRWRTSVREGGAKLVNTLGEEFIEKFDSERGLYTTRDFLNIAVENEYREGRGPVYLDLTDVPMKNLEEEFRNMHGSYFPMLYRERFDWSREPIEVRVGAHHLMGGVRINERAETGVPGLYAAGEVVGGIHGANRLGGNALTSILVFGRIAGSEAARYASSAEYVGVQVNQIEEEQANIYKYMDKTTRDGISPIAVRKKLQKLMLEKVGVIKNGVELEEGLRGLIEIQEKELQNLSLSGDANSCNTEWVDAILLPRMLETAEIMARTALHRTESRGAHYRLDYPERNDTKWLRNIVVKRVEGEIHLRDQPIVVTKLHPG